MGPALQARCVANAGGRRVGGCTHVLPRWASGLAEVGKGDADRIALGDQTSAGVGVRQKCAAVGRQPKRLVVGQCEPSASASVDHGVALISAATAAPETSCASRNSTATASAATSSGTGAAAHRRSLAAAQERGGRRGNRLESPAAIGDLGAAQQIDKTMGAAREDGLKVDCRDLGGSVTRTMTLAHAAPQTRPRYQWAR